MPNHATNPTSLRKRYSQACPAHGARQFRGTRNMAGVTSSAEAVISGGIGVALTRIVGVYGGNDSRGAQRVNSEKNV